MSVPRAPSIWIDGAYGAIAPNMIRGIVTSTRRRYDGISSTTREIGFIRWTLESHSDRTSEKAAKKVLEEEIVVKSNYATTAGIRIRESSGAKASFWPKALENPHKTDSVGSEASRKASKKLRDGSAPSIRIACTPYANYMRCM